MLQAICEAVTRPNMHFVPIKSTEQQAILSLHRIRQGYVKARTAQANQIRGLLAEFGLEIPQGIGYISKRVPDILEDASNELPGILRIEIQSLLEHLNELNTRADNCEKKFLHGINKVKPVRSWRQYLGLVHSPPQHLLHR